MACNSSGACLGVEDEEMRGQRIDTYGGHGGDQHSGHQHIGGGRGQTHTHDEADKPDDQRHERHDQGGQGNPLEALLHMQPTCWSAAFQLIRQWHLTFDRPTS